jgi:hemerythrin
MAFFTWKPTYTVGIKDMDTQHQAMINIINKLYDAMKSGKGSQELGTIISEMVDYTHFHFSSEEKVLAAAGYPELAKQKAEHAAFIRRVNEFQNQFKQGKLALSVEVLGFLKEWWSGHIQGEDKKYSIFLNDKGIH